MRMRTKELRLINVKNSVNNMSLFNYFHAAVQNDNPFGQSVPAKTLVGVSKQVKAAQEKRRKRGPYI